MKSDYDVTPDEIEAFLDRLGKDAEASGYHLNPNVDFTKELIRGLLVNIRRYGYASCPCRLSEGDRWKDADIICPCDYRDPDLHEFGACYCALYVSDSIAKGERQLEPVPERRSPGGERRELPSSNAPAGIALSHPVWRCRVCGYLCAREQPPETCPICKAGKERFERFV